MMKVFVNILKKLTHTRALDDSSGELETLFFEPIYRASYVAGLSESDKNMGYQLYSFIVKFWISMFVCSELLYIFTDASDFDETAACINCVIIQIASFYRYRNMAAHRDMYKKLAMAMETPYFDISTEKRKKIVEYWAKLNFCYVKLLLILGIFITSSWSLYPVLDDVEYNVMVAVRLPIDYRTPILYPIAYLIIIVPFLYTAYSVIVIDLTLQSYLLHMVCHFNIVADCFENILIDCEDSNVLQSEMGAIYYSKAFIDHYLKRLSELVEQHRNLMKLVLDLRTTMSRPMLGQLVASGLLICLIGFQAVTNIEENFTRCVSNLFFLVYNLIGFYIICRWCEEITIQSKNIGLAVYSSGWEKGVILIPTVRSSLMLVIARANKPVVLSAGGMYDLSLVSYSKLVKTSYSALTVLLRFR